MDKYEYRLKTEEMLRCVADKDYKQAEAIADTIDWRRVKSVSMLCAVSDIYDACGRYEDAREILFIAYDRAPNNRKIIFGLTELAIKTGDLAEARDCYEEYVSVAPHDGNRHVLKYELLKAQKAPIEEQIQALEEFKGVEYTERWAYELAKLYEKAGQSSKCISECDDIFLWFSDGKYVRRALELKRKYRPLTPTQAEVLTDDADDHDEDLEANSVQRNAKILLDNQRREAASRGIDTERLEETRMAQEQREVERAKIAERIIPEKLQNVDDDMVFAEWEAPTKRRSWAAPDEYQESEIAEEPDDDRTMVLPKEEELFAAEAAPEKPESSLQIEFFEDISNAVESQLRKKDELTESREAEEERRAAKRREQEEREARMQRQAAEDDRLREEERARAALEAEAYRGEEMSAMLRQREEENRQSEQKMADRRDEVKQQQRFEAELERRVKEETEKIRQELEAAKQNFYNELVNFRQEAMAAEDRRKKAEEAALKAKEEAEETTRRAREEIAKHAAAADAARQVAADATRDAQVEIAKHAAAANAARQAAADAARQAAEAEAARQIADEARKAADAERQRVTEEAAKKAEEAARKAAEEAAKRAADEEAARKAVAAATAAAPAAVVTAVERITGSLPTEEVRSFREQRVAAPAPVKPEAPAPKAPVAPLAEEEDGQMSLAASVQAAFEVEDEFTEPEAPVSDIEVDDIAALLEKMTLAGLSGEEPAPIEEPVGPQGGTAINNFVYDPTANENKVSLSEKFDLEKKTKVGTDAGLTEEQKNLFSYFVPVKGMSEQLVEVLRSDKMFDRQGTSKCGNLLIIGSQGSGKTVLAVDVVKAIQKQREMKSGKIAIINAEAFNRKNVAETIKKIQGGSLIIENAGVLSDATLASLNVVMSGPTSETLFVLEDQKAPMERLLSRNPEFTSKFNSCIEVPVFVNDDLVTFGQTYAHEHGYKIDELGILALYSRIDMMQREDHAVTVAEVKDIMDAAFARSKKNSMKRTMTNLFKRSDKSELITLVEDDFAY